MSAKRWYVTPMLLMGSHSYRPAAVPFQRDNVPLLRRFAEMMNQHGLPAVLHAKRALDAAAGAPALPPEIDAFLDQRFVSNSPASLSAMIDVLCEQPDNVVELGDKAVDAVVIVGVRDDVWSPAEQHDFTTRLGARVVDIAAAGHSPAVEAPEARSMRCWSLSGTALSRRCLLPCRLVRLRLQQLHQRLL